MASGPDDACPSAPPIQPRRSIPLALQLFVAILLLLGVSSSAWFVVRVWRYDAGIRAIDEAGGRYVAESNAPAWLSHAPARDWVAKDFATVPNINLHGSPITDDALRRVSRL